MQKWLFLTLLLIGQIDSRLLVATSPPLRQAQGSDEYKILISPEEWSELDNFKEQEDFSANFPILPPDEIYSIGLQGLHDPTLLERNKRYAASFPILMNLFSRTSEFYTRFKRMAVPGTLSVDENRKDGLQNYQVTRDLTLTIVHDFAGLNSEVEDLFHHINYFSTTVEESVELLGFKTLLDDALTTHDQSSAEFQELLKKIELRAYDFTAKLKMFLESIYGIRHFDMLAFQFFEKFAKGLVWEEGALDTEAKITASVDIIKKGLDFKLLLERVFGGLETGIGDMLTARTDVFALLTQLNDLPKLENVSL